MKIEKKHDSAIDLLRIVSILAVIAIHTTTKTLEVTNYSLRLIPFTLLLNQLTRFAVPIFFIVSGFVLTLNYHLNENYLSYFKKRINKIFIPYIFWSLIYYFFVYYKGRDLSFLDSLLQGNASYQLYFIPTLIIFYMIFPIIYVFCQHIGNKFFMIFIFLVQIFLLFIDYKVNSIPLFNPARVALLNYFPFVLGIFIARNIEAFNKFVTKWKYVLMFGTFIFGTVVFAEGFYGYMNTHNYLVFYSQWRPSVLLFTVCIGGLFYWVFDKANLDKEKIKKIANLSFLVFFIHVLILEILWREVGVRIFDIKYTQNLWWDPIYFIVVTLFSFGIAYLIHKIPKLSKITG